jgi:glycosyltransferase involved in cell wall biosynthesis
VRQKTSQPGTPLGVNVAGYLHAESGLGSAVRRYVQAIRAVNIPHALVDLSDLQANRAEDRSLTAGSGDLVHGVNVVVAGIDSHYAVVQKLGQDFFNDRYTVGVWAWELPRFPEKWFDRFAYFDEIWVGTSFIASTLAPIAPVPVIRMPPVLTVERSGSREAGRRRLGVPPDEFVFLFVFDVCSLLARKNPGAVIEAFARAFAPGEPVRLVLKCVNGSSAPEAMEKLSSAARASRVTILDAYWSAAEMADLMAAADAYVSLHRSEGTGLTISDAMAHALPVVATGWSGSSDFLTPFTGFPVAYDLVALEQNVGPYARGEMWANPSIEHAAVLMRQVVDAPEAARALARRRAETWSERTRPMRLAV